VYGVVLIGTENKDTEGNRIGNEMQNDFLPDPAWIQPEQMDQGTGFR